MQIDETSFPRAFGDRITDQLEVLLDNLQPDGSIRLLNNPLVYPQQAIMPLAFCWAGLDPQARWKGSVRVREAIAKLGTFLCQRFDGRGHFVYNSHGYDVDHVDQRLTYAWCEALRILREAGGDFDFGAWEDKILRACGSLWEHRVKKLAGLRRFFARVTGTGTNHAALYLTTIFRAGQGLGRPGMCADVLPIARALAADVHPDGYWEEHGDLSRRGGPTPIYNYLTHQGMSLMYEWTGEKVFLDAIEKSARFHSTFCYPDATFVDVIDERVRYRHAKSPSVWGLFGFSHWPWGRGAAAAHFRGYAKFNTTIYNRGEELARLCENYMYWPEGPTEPAPFERADHQGTLALGGAVARRGAWFLAGCSMPGRNSEDPCYLDNPFALDRQKLFSVWHERTGLLIDGSNSKRQPANSTFSAGEAAINVLVQTSGTQDFYPDSGSVNVDAKGLSVHAVYKTFEADVRLEPDGDGRLTIYAQVDPAACPLPIMFAFTLRPAERLTTLGGVGRQFGDQPWELSGAELGGGFTLGPVTVRGPAETTVQWPMSPFESYHKDAKADPSQNLVRVAIPLTRERAATKITLEIGQGIVDS